MTTIRKISLTVLIAGLVAGVAAFGAFSAFSATTSNTGNSFASGTVAIGDNDGGSAALYTSANNKPGTPVVSCISVAYTGSLTSQVKLYASNGITGGTDLHLTVERGMQSTGSFPACGDFAPTSTAYDGALAAFPTTLSAGVDGKPSPPGTWVTNDTVTYRFTVTVVDDATPNAHTTVTSSGSHDFTWEARNT